MSDESVLRRKAREAIQSGRLPNRGPERMWGGPGVGARCTICARPIERSEVEFELQFCWDDAGGSGNYRLHLRCFAAWELERETAETVRTSATGERARLTAAQCTTGRVPQSSSPAASSPAASSVTVSSSAESSGAATSDAASSDAILSSCVLPAAGEDGMMPRRERDPRNNRGPA